ncbi:transaldolase [Auraticoccus monumenti]|uniref:Transaldolase n=1 Tax=Auraticoccus monumenti TaxID=675864 RepID=A0A1G7DGH5_9ACTN|nr:transaldolase [Auraticoccus monumenti]SDE50704.1 transaldolase [Auraticoccus monumenti]
MSERLQQLAEAGVSIWLDDLSRERIASGDLARQVAERSVTGVTTNPTIFATAVSTGDSYEPQLTELKGSEVSDAITAITTDDVRAACDVLGPVATRTDGVDGRVSIEVEPGLAMDTDGTVAQAKDLRARVGRPNVLIKIPATEPGLPAIRSVIAAGISVNVTLIFSLQRYRAVLDAYLSGLEDAADAGHELSDIHSVASFFVSRVDSEVDKRLDAIGTDEAKALKGKAAVANARLAHALFRRVVSGEELDGRWPALAAKGARPQRPLWASTGVKDPNLPDTLYVTELVTSDTVNTMPEKTMDAFADHGEVEGDRVVDLVAEAEATMADLERVGIDIDDVTRVLEEEGVKKFADSWDELVSTVQEAISAAA